MMSDKARWLNGLVAVAHGRGFVVAAAGERFVVTAGHCLPQLPPCASFTPPDEKTYADLLGPVGSKPNVWAECVFVDLVSDLAVLRAPDARAMRDQSQAFRALVQSALPLPIGRLAVSRSDRQQAASDGWLVSLAGRWFGCKVRSQGRGVWIADAAEAIRGGSGGPIVTPDGVAIGVLCTASSADGYRSGGPNPELAAHLPGWMVRDVRPALAGDGR